MKSLETNDLRCLYPLLLDVLTELLEKDRLAHVVLTAECVIDAAKQQVPAWKDGTLFLTCITIFSRSNCTLE